MGRLFAEGVSLRNAPNRVRLSARNSMWDVDIQDRHFALVNHLARGAAFPTPNIDRYV
jgi:hypothetical protein